MVRPWAEAGYQCLCLDIQHSIRREQQDGLITKRWADIRSLTPADLPEPAIIFAFPDCTNLAVSGARDFQRKGLQRFIDALQLVESCRRLCEWYGCPWMLENPVSRLSTAWRKPDYTFHPWEYGDGYLKRTCLWTGGGFVMPEPSVHEQGDADDRIWKMPPTADRANKRSETPMGFARAVFQANCQPVLFAEEV